MNSTPSRMWNLEPPDYSDTTTTTTAEAQPQEEIPTKPSIYPILFDRQNRDSRDPIGYLATYLYQYAARKTISRENDEGESSQETEGNSSPLKPDASLRNEEPKPSEDSSRTPLEVVREDPEFDEEDEDEFALEFEDHTKMKDEEGQTVLHFAAARVHPDGSFYALLSHAEVLLAERDSLYRTCRDVAEDSGQEENAAAVDRFVFDAFLQQRSSLVRMLPARRVRPSHPPLRRVQEGAHRRAPAAELTSSLALIREVADFVGGGGFRGEPSYRL
ncbi:tankyrase-1 [Caerostris extrusa]|uniref:Tankyrase-1 n=1 Tax=Caerostris extrusa TaxID=172846 RepID=A0AAV4T1M1_CAEEX|nr:tankyrase-1 [Caerostris extrusa]